MKSTKRNSHVAGALAAAVLAATLSAASARAATSTWYYGGTAVDSPNASVTDWNTPGNWFPTGGPAGNWNNGDTATFGLGGTGNATLTVSVPTTASGLIFNAGPIYTISSLPASLTLTGTVTTNQNAVLDGAVTFGGPLTKDGAGTLTLTGAADASAGNSWTVNAGTLILSKSITNYSGSITAGTFNTAATLQLGAAEQIVTGGSVTLNRVGTFNLNGFNQTLDQLNLTAGGTVTSGAGILYLNNVNAINYTTTTNSWVANIAANIGLNNGGTAGVRNFNISHDVVANPQADVTMSGVISDGIGGAGSIVKNGNGNLLLTGTNTFTGSTSIYNGKLVITSDANFGAVPATATTNIDFSNNATLQVYFPAGDLTLNANRTISIGSNNTTTIDTNSRNLTIAGLITKTGTTNANLTKAGVGMLVLGDSSSNNSYNDLNINTGTVKVFGNPGTGQISLSPSTLLDVRNDGTGSNGTINFGNTFNIGNAAVTLNVQNAAVSGGNTGNAVQFGNLIAGTGPVLTITGANGYRAVFANCFDPNQPTFNPTTADMEINGAFTNLSNNGFTKTGQGTLTLSGTANNTVGSITVNAGTLLLAKSGTANAMGGSGAGWGGTLTVGPAGTGAAPVLVKYTGNSTDMIKDSSTVVINPTGTLDFNGATDTVGNTNGNGLTINATANGLAGSLINTAGGGTYTLGNSTASGVNGTLLFKGGGSVNTSTGTLVLGGFVTTNAAVGFTSQTATIAGKINLGSGSTAVSRTFSTALGNTPSGIDLLVSATIADGTSVGSNLFKIGTGLLVLSGSNSYSGGTTLQGNPASGTLGIGNDYALGTGPLNLVLHNNVASYQSLMAYGAARTIANNVVVTGSNFGQQGFSISGSNNLTFNGTFTLNGVNQATEIQVVNAGTVATITNGLATANGVNGNTGLYKNGLGTLVLGTGGTSGYAGGTTVNAGALVVKAANATNAVTLNANTNTAFTLSDAGSILNANLTATTATLNVDNTATSLAARFGAAKTLSLTYSTFNLTGNASATTNHSVGNLTFAGNVNLSLNSLSNQLVSLTTAGVKRSGSGTLVLLPSATTTLGGTGKLISTSAPALTTGLNAGTDTLAPAYYVDGTNYSYLTYDATNGFLDANWSANNLATASVAGLDILKQTAPATLSALVKVTALRTDAAISGGTVQIFSGGLILDSNDTHTANISFKNAGNTAVEGLVYVPNGFNSTLAGIVSANVLTKFGSGTLTLANSANAYTGALNINAGTVRVVANGALPAGNSITLPNAPGSALQLDGVPVSMSSFGGGGNLGGNLILSNNATASVTGGNTTFGGQITGSGSLALSNSGRLTLSNTTNNFVGSTTVSAATLTIAAPSGLTPDTILGAAANPLTLQNAATLSFNANSTGFNWTPAARTITIGTGGATLTANGDNMTLATANQLRGSDPLTVSIGYNSYGTSLTLSAAQPNFSGGFRLVNGYRRAVNLIVSAPGVLGTNTVSAMSAGTTITYPWSGQQYIGGVASGLFVANQGLLDLQGDASDHSSFRERVTVGPLGVIRGNTYQLYYYTRVSAFSATPNSSEVILAPNSIVAFVPASPTSIVSSTDSFYTGSYSDANYNIYKLGTASDLLFGLGNDFNDPTFNLTIGNNTPWKGLATDGNLTDAVTRTLSAGHITVNAGNGFSEFQLVGAGRSYSTNDVGLNAGTLVFSGTSSTFSIINGTANAHISGPNTVVQLSATAAATGLSAVGKYIVDPGSELRSTTANGFSGKAVDLNGAYLAYAPTVAGNDAAGAITVAQESGLYINYKASGDTLTLGSLTRNGKAFLNVYNGHANALGLATGNTEKILVGTATASLMRGKIVDPWIMSIQANVGSSNANPFLTYDATNGFGTFNAYSSNPTTAPNQGDIVKITAATTVVSGSLDSLVFGGNINNSASTSNPTATLTTWNLGVLADGSQAARAGIVVSNNYNNAININLNAGTSEIVINANYDGINALRTHTINGNVITTGGLTKAGMNELVLNGTLNSISGNISILGGSGVNGLGGAGGLTIGGGNGLNPDVMVTISPLAAFRINNVPNAVVPNTQTIGGLAGAGTVSIANGKTLEVSNASTASSFDGYITGAGSFTKSGASAFTFTNPTALSYTGTTTLNGGSLNLAKAAVDNSFLSLGAVAVTGGTFAPANNDILFASGAATQEHNVSACLALVAAPTGSNLIKTTGVMKAATYTSNNFLGTTFHGQTMGADALVLKYTVAGDTNFDGTISMDDYLATDAGYLMGGSNWVNGDFNHDGVVNAKDYALIDFNNAILHPGSGETMEALHTTWFGADYTNALADLTSAVPEPASVGLLALGAIGLLARRRR